MSASILGDSKAASSSFLNSIPIARVLNRYIKFNGHHLLQRYRYWIYVDSSSRRMTNLYIWLKQGLLEFVTKSTNITLFSL